MRIGRELKNKAVLFADISDSSALYKKLGDTVARNMVDACVETISGVIARHEGVVVKKLGDAVMCLFPSDRFCSARSRRAAVGRRGGGASR